MLQPALNCNDQTKPNHSSVLPHMLLMSTEQMQRSLSLTLSVSRSDIRCRYIHHSFPIFMLVFRRVFCSMISNQIYGRLTDFKGMISIKNRCKQYMRVQIYDSAVA